MLNDQEKYFSPLLYINDFTALIITYLVCSPLSFAVIHRSGGLFSVPPVTSLTHMSLPLEWDRYLRLVPLLILTGILMLKMTGAYRYARLQHLGAITSKTAAACSSACCIFIFLFFIFDPLLSGNTCFILLFFSMAWALLSGHRFALLVCIRHTGSRYRNARRVLIAGANRLALQIADLIDTHPEWGLDIAGYVATDKKSAMDTTYGRHRVLGRLEGLHDILDNTIADCIFFAQGPGSIRDIESIAQCCATRGIELALTSEALHAKLHGVHMEHLGTHTVFTFTSTRRRPAQLFIKRLWDIFASGVMITLCLPFWAIIPIMIRRDSPGPAIFKQERIGKNGRRFTMYKFRSMVVGAEDMQADLADNNEVDGPVFKIKNDPRLTRMGRFLRHTSIDELPQLFNVLKGDMSMVGPRPPLFSEFLHYRPWEKKRISVTPGITCLWQVSGRSELNFAEWMKLDAQYIDNWSLLLDLKILLRTIIAVLSRRGAQ